jgi:hypothetical protein
VRGNSIGVRRENAGGLFRRGGLEWHVLFLIIFLRRNLDVEWWTHFRLPIRRNWHDDGLSLQRSRTRRIHGRKLHQDADLTPDVIAGGYKAAPPRVVQVFQPDRVDRQQRAHCGRRGG